ncbi:E3 ubiquitin-protein ligase ZNRF1 isoform X1 [Schistocerca americana]|uniref:E3 ubiquitin-protein ligase ZNRF1 isoform X1 n=1 Tax=Schistocerca americana TaxID=7009 RepID=UPI001F4F4802|nr:E3 ubiquitin-protein ligase ZNRF1 isoform X1 [Schistocerca americana]XP_046992964.1 E3 ubiquitin-protein ligase ZNRF1 isoform X1 [Schistocerca americana]
MGAKASTANGGGSSPRTRTFSTSSSSDVVAAGSTGFSLLRAIPGAVSSDRQRARSLSSVPDSHSSHEAIGIPNASVGAYDISESPETDSSSPEDHVLVGPLAANISLGRVYAAHSLPSNIWPLNGQRGAARLLWGRRLGGACSEGIKCPVCAKFVLPDDIECHLVMCLTKPRLSYNEDVLADDKGECVICLEDLQQGDIIARLPCLCIYHKSCIDRWFEVNRSCPEHPGD